MLDRHAVQALLAAGVRPREAAKQFGVSRRTIKRIAREAAVTTDGDALVRGGKRPGRPAVAAAVGERVAAWLAEEPELSPGEVWRRLGEDGTPLGLSTVYRVLAGVRATLPAELLVRFEGVAGEFAQFDFGKVSVRLVDGRRRVVHFAAYRLKYSRWIHAGLVPNERVEALVRSLLASFEGSGGVPLRVVFDNPKTVVLRYEQGRPVWNGTLGQVAIDYGFTVERLPRLLANLRNPFPSWSFGAVLLIAFDSRASPFERELASLPPAATEGLRLLQREWPDVFARAFYVRLCAWYALAQRAGDSARSSQGR